MSIGKIEVGNEEKHIDVEKLKSVVGYHSYQDSNYTELKQFYCPLDFSGKRFKTIMDRKT